MEADETKKECLVQILHFKFARGFKSVRITSLAFSATTRNKTPQNLLPTKIFNYLMCEILYTQNLFTYMVV